MDNNYKEFCLNEYKKIFAEKLETLQIKNDEKRRIAAQKIAIKNASINSIKHFPDIEPTQIWKTVYEAHINNVSGVADTNVIKAVISADNSWKKSSGHAFEEMIKELGNISLEPHGIEIVLQRDLNQLIHENNILNEERDIKWLKEQIATSIFDLYLIKKQEDKYFVFGCVQSKTSIRERVTRDREPSINAMKHYFLSVAIVLDGDFLRLPKFRNMVNGNSAEYELNGWHGLYVFSNVELEIDRIHSIDISMKKFVKDVVEGSIFWTTQRQWFDHTWRPERIQI